MTQCCHHLHESTNNWVPVILVCPVLACSGFVVWVCVLFGFVLCVFAVCLVYDDDGPMDYVQVLPQFSFAALNSRWPGTLICITAHAMSYSVVNDLAKAMKALDGKKRHRREGTLFKDRSGPGQERGGSVDVIWSQVDAVAMTWPFAVFRDWEGNFSSPFS